MQFTLRQILCNQKICLQFFLDNRVATNFKKNTLPRVGELSSDSDVERMRGHSSDHPIMPISWLLKIPCCELVDDRSTWLLTKPYHWFGHKRPSSGPWRWTLKFGQVHTFPSLSLSLWALWKMHIFTNSNSAKKGFLTIPAFPSPWI